MDKKVVIIGAGGHAKVIADIIKKSGDIVYGFLDDNIEKNTIIIEYPESRVIGKIRDCEKIQSEDFEVKFIIGIGNNKLRKEISKQYKLNYYTAIHPSVAIGLDVFIGEGTVAMANSCINTSVKIGKHCIINTGSIIEHDNVLEDYVHISPNATLGGTVKIGEYTHIGISATVKNNIEICKDCIIGAGAVVVKDIKEKGTYIGVPARRMD